MPDNVVAPIAYGVFEIKVEGILHDKAPRFASYPPSPSQLVNNWTDSWEEFFTRQFRSDVAYAQRVLGRCPDLEELTDRFVDKVVPRLLRPLETGDHNIKPSLCHGDIWDGNVQ